MHVSGDLSRYPRILGHLTETIIKLLGEVKSDVEMIPIPHTYTFGTHATAARKEAAEYIFVAK